MPYKYSVCMPDGCPSSLQKDKCLSKNKYYRLVENLPISEKDFLPHLLIPAKKAVFDSQKRSALEPCKWCSVSVFKNLDDFFEIIKINVRLKEFFVVTGEIDGSVHGVILKTPSKSYPSHVDWFPYKEVEEINMFKEVVYATN